MIAVEGLTKRYGDGLNVRPDPMSLQPWTGFGLFCLYAAIMLGLAAWRLRRRDV